jgi:gluconolactonase
VIFTPDEKTLLFVDNFLPNVFACDVNSDGTLSAARVYADLTVPPAKPGSNRPPNAAAIGTCMDTEGHLYVGANNGLQVIDAKGKNLGTITLPERPMNMTFGRKDPFTMYIATGNSMYSLEMKIKGICFPQLQ